MEEWRDTAAAILVISVCPTWDFLERIQRTQMLLKVELLGRHQLGLEAPKRSGDLFVPEEGVLRKKIRRKIQKRRARRVGGDRIMCRRPC